MNHLKQIIFFFLLLFSLPIFSATEILLLKDNLQRANPGDYLVTVQNKTYTLLHIKQIDENLMVIEEISIPTGKISIKNFPWKDWVLKGAPQHTAWVMYRVDLSTGETKDFFSYTRGVWDKTAANNFLSTLLNLPFTKTTMKDRKKVGLIGTGKVWQPKMVVNGQVIENVYFDAWKTKWPKDQSELSGRLIEIYLPSEKAKYSAYFPYWLEISGMVGNAKIRIIDSGNDMHSPQSSFSKNKL